MYVCFIACYYELLMLIYMNHNIDICWNCINICEWTLMNIYATYLTANKPYSFVFKYSKEPVPVIVECTKHHYITEGPLHMHTEEVPWYFVKLPNIKKFLLQILRCPSNMDIKLWGVPLGMKLHKAPWCFVPHT